MKVIGQAIKTKLKANIEQFEPIISNDLKVILIARQQTAYHPKKT